LTVTTCSEAETSDVGRALAASLQKGAVVLLSGDLGAGKTAFVRGLAEGLGIDPGEVSSPTFTLRQEYRGGRMPLHHVDLYRLRPVDVADIGLEDEALDQGVTAIEWPDRLPRPIDSAVCVSIAYGDGDTRSIRIQQAPGGPHGPRGEC
jgi:tRNA threonylcarbamoyladenosine biosynthesis protein TsaE